MQTLSNPLKSKHPFRSDPDVIERKLGQVAWRPDGEHPLHSYVKTSQQTKAYVQMHTNDYLSIANDLRIAQTKADFLSKHGHGDSISRIFTHDRIDIAKEFEQKFSRLTKAEDAVMLMSGYNANTGLIQAFASPEIPVYIDQRAHASLWEGILCARAKARPFRHNDIDDLKKKILRFGPGIIAIDALYSTTGTIAPLEEFVTVAEQGECAIIVDETHSFGCHGPKGAGLVVKLGLEDRVHFRTIGLSKAIAARGGVVIGSRRNMEYLRYEARPLIFSTSVLEYEVAGFQKTLDILSEESWRQKKLHRNHKALKDGLLSLGYDVKASDAQIIGIVIGPNERANIFKCYLEKHGIAGAPFAPPATPVGKSMIRLTVNAALTQEQIDYTLQVCESAKRDLDTSDWICFN